MPFYAKDWRSPGEVWVKTEDGWEKKKILECQSNCNLARSDNCDDKENCALDNSAALDKWKGSIPPYCQITLRCTKEIAGFNGLSDALHRLDFRSAVRDQRRFSYTVKLLDLLLSQQRITTLSGCAQKSVLNVLEEIAVQAQASKQNVHVLHKLLSDLRRTIRGDSWWGQPLGSSQLWGQHVQTIDRIDAIASNIPITKPDNEDKRPKFEDLPEECVREILFRLADHKDLFSVAEAYSLAQELSAEQHLWKRLCRYHFTPIQINFVLDEIRQEEEKNPLHNLNKICRNNRSNHPYLNNNLRRSPGRNGCHHVVNGHTTDESSDDPFRSGMDHRRRRNNESNRVRVSNAFHEHLNRHRENLRNLQQNDNGNGNINLQHGRISFEDVRNHFDQRNENDQPLPNARQSDLDTECRPDKNKNEHQGNQSKVNVSDWEYIFHRLRRRFGLREEYAETLHLCRTCRCLFWKTYGHPCIAEDFEKRTDSDSLYVPVPPHAFLKFFSL